MEHIHADNLETDEPVGAEEDEDYAAPNFLKDMTDQYARHCEYPQE
jgi:hypothetical protein